MKYKQWIVICLLIMCGCSGANSALEPAENSKAPSMAEKNSPMDWIWDAGLYCVSADHSTVERLPNREGDYHFNVTKLIEPPNCSNCLKIGKIKVQPDGTLKVDVTLRHPFPNIPFYTGFDVRGTIIFPATRYWKREPPWIITGNDELIFQDFIPIYFSRAEDGGGQLLNADGFTLYFFPGFNVPGFDQPIFKYQKGQHAYGPDPDSTVNGYKVFTNDPERRMFLTTDAITHTYHIDPPDGEFIFGYVVDANWTPPIKTPVTDPKNDFPPWANCEDGYILDVEQYNPFKLGTYGPPAYPPWPIIPEYEERFITATTIQVYPRGNPLPAHFETWVICPDLTSDPWLQTHGVAYSETKCEVLDPEGITFKSYQGIYMGSYDAQPGKYWALICVCNDQTEFGWTKEDNPWPIMFRTTLFFDFVYLDAIAGDG